ncbi:MAG: PQQ-like beta-propeller repeat protein [Bacteroidales bacterium]|nr:PQQ-like beta-propeller repeat protein [Bacteroidales bacterium]
MRNKKYQANGLCLSKYFIIFSGIFLLLLISLVNCTNEPSATLKTWLYPGYNEKNCGFAPADYIGEITTPSVKWSHAIDFGTSVILTDDLDGDNKIEIISVSSRATDNRKQQRLTVICLENNGAEKWKWQTPHYFISNGSYPNTDPGEKVWACATLVGGAVIVNKRIIIAETLKHQYYGGEVDFNGYLICLNSDGTVAWSYHTLEGDPNFVTAHDIDKDSVIEVIAGTDEPGCIYCLNSDTGELEWSNSNSNITELENGAAIADIDGDGEIEIVTADERKGGMCFTSNGSIKWMCPDGPHEAWPALMDINSDSKMEILCSSENTSCMNYDGKIKWIKPYGSKPDEYGGKSIVALGDINDDGIVEFVYLEKTNVVCRNAETGNTIWSYNTPEDIEFNSAVLACDIDGDGANEILFTGRTNHAFYCLSHTGALEWKLDVPSSPMGGFAITDIDNDGSVEVIFGTDNKVYCIDKKD